jgi:hypothetical protein
VIRKVFPEPSLAVAKRNPEPVSTSPCAFGGVSIRTTVRSKPESSLSEARAVGFNRQNCSRRAKMPNWSWVSKEASRAATILARPAAAAESRRCPWPGLYCRHAAVQREGPAIQGIGQRLGARTGHQRSIPGQAGAGSEVRKDLGAK